MAYLDENRLLSDKQHAFRKWHTRSCETQLTTVIPGGGGGGGRLLVNRIPMREQRTAKLTLNGVFNIFKLIPLFTLSSQKVTLSNVVN